MTDDLSHSNRLEPSDDVSAVADEGGARCCICGRVIPADRRDCPDCGGPVVKLSRRKSLLLGGIKGCLRALARRWRSVLAVTLVFSCGYGLRMRQDAHQTQRERMGQFDRAMHNYPDWLLWNGGRELKEAMRRDFRERFEAQLKSSWHPLGIDLRWGEAFLVLKDPGWLSWGYNKQMRQETQDDLVRYLCYRIEIVAQHGVEKRCRLLRPEFKALESYPEGTLSRNSQMVTRMLERVLLRDRPEDETGLIALDFLASSINQEWAKDFAWEYLKRYRPAHTSGLNRFLWKLIGAAAHNQDGAQATLARFHDNSDELSSWVRHGHYGVSKGLLKELDEHPEWRSQESPPPEE